MDSSHPAEGGCTCGQLRYKIAGAPMFVHCCHCRWCQRQSGAAFAVNAMIEADRLVHLKGEPELIPVPTPSGAGQVIARCPACKIAIWSYYGGAGEKIRFFRVGTLDQPDQIQPDIHVYTSSKQPWVILPEGVPAVPEFYKAKAFWPAESLERRRAVLGF